jgi:hypothetical protein
MTTTTSKSIRAITAVLLLAAAALTACSAAPPPEPHTSEPGGVAGHATSCDARAEQGKSEVLPVVEQNRACTSDADCVTINVGTNCFDVCSRAVNKQGAAAVEKAEAQVNATTCATYKADGCKLIPPPCMAPAPAKCNAGKCG